MEPGFQLFPEQASSVAPRVDALYGFLLVVTASCSAAICTAIVYFAIKYRRNRPKDEPRPHSRQLWMLETTWITIPFLLTMVMFFWGARLYFEIRTPPANAIELQ